jgi:amino acid transporter
MHPAQYNDALRRRLGVAAVTAFVIGQVIAVGIFLTPASMARSLGSPAWLLLVWLVMGGMALTGALCYGELAARFPEAGRSRVRGCPPNAGARRTTVEQSHIVQCQLAG